MSWTIDSSGTATGTIGVQQVLAAGSTTNATYVAKVRLNNLAIGDIVELRLFTMTLANGTLEVVWKGTYGPSPPITTVAISPPVPSDQSIELALTQIAGTARTFDWELLRF